MSTLKIGALTISIAVAVLVEQAQAQAVGRPLSEADIANWDISVAPDGANLPAGEGSVAQGAKLYQHACAFCHGDTGTEGPADRLVGGFGTLTSAAPVKTVGSFWPYATTVFDYIRRAMPYYAPGSLSDDETYAITAYLLHLNGLLPDDATLDAAGLLSVTMPNADGFVTHTPPQN